MISALACGGVAEWPGLATLVRTEDDSAVNSDASSCLPVVTTRVTRKQAVEHLDKFAAAHSQLDGLANKQTRLFWGGTGPLEHEHVGFGAGIDNRVDWAGHGVLNHGGAYAQPAEHALAQQLLGILHFDVDVQAAQLGSSFTPT